MTASHPADGAGSGADVTSVGSTAVPPLDEQPDRTPSTSATTTAPRITAASSSDRDDPGPVGELRERLTEPCEVAFRIVGGDPHDDRPDPGTDHGRCARGVDHRRRCAERARDPPGGFAG